MKETIKQAGYEYLYYDPFAKEHVLRNESEQYEAWKANKNYASHGLIYKNTHLEFCRSLNHNQ